MNPLLFQIAFRYLVSKKSTNAINWITWVAMTGMGLVTMALILVLSVFNGFEGLVISLYRSFNPDVQITAAEGKVFAPDSEALEKIAALPEVAYVSKVLEETVILEYNEHQQIATLKGVDNQYAHVNGVDEKMVAGKFVLSGTGDSYAVLGSGVAGSLLIDLQNTQNPIAVYLPKRGKKTMSLDASREFIKKNILPGGVFEIQQEFDSKYVLVPLDFMNDVLDYDDEVSALEIKLKPGANTEMAKRNIEGILGSGFFVKDRYEQNKFLYRIMRMEKWAVYAILALILLIAAFNIVGSLSMLVIEKTKDIAILKTMGADDGMIRKIFLLEGLFTSLAGSLTGALLAVVICLVQINFGVLELGGGTFVVKAFPVEMQSLDFVLIGATVIVISVGTSWVPAQRAASRSAIIVQE